MLTNYCNLSSKELLSQKLVIPYGRSLLPLLNANWMRAYGAFASNSSLKSYSGTCTTFIRSIRPEVFLRKGVLKTCNKFTGEHPCGGVISIKLLSNFIEITLRYGCSPVNLLHIFRSPFPRNTSHWLLLIYTLQMMAFL